MYPSRQITGQVFTSGGDLVIAGSIEAWLVPPGGVVLDTLGSGLRYKASSRARGRINTVGIQSFALTALDSMSPLDAYYQVKFDVRDPVEESWYELWRVTGPDSGALALGDIIPVGYGPALTSGYIPVQFVTVGVVAVSGIAQVLDEGISLPQRSSVDFTGESVVATDVGGRTKVDIRARATRINSLSEITYEAVKRGEFFIHTRVSSMGDAIYIGLMTSTNTFVPVLLAEAP